MTFANKIINAKKTKYLNLSFTLCRETKNKDTTDTKKAKEGENINNNIGINNKY